VLIPSFVGPVAQRSLITRCLREHACSPNESNLDAHYRIPLSGLWNEWEAVSKRRLVEPDFDVVVGTKWQEDLSPEKYHPPDAERALVDNTPGSLDTLPGIKSQPKLAPMPSSSLPPSTVSALIPKLRWSNIGLNYHWGTKSYDFEREKVPFPDDIRDICMDAVRSIDWKDVWEDVADGMDWADGEDWNVWEHTYGVFICLNAGFY
jgi:alkylated DNA repair protein alkB family protein 1